MYGPQLRIYDATRRWYLLGREAMLQAIEPGAEDTVLEVGCGTARNLLWLGRRYPAVRLFGADISPAMLSAAAASAARAGLTGRVQLAAVPAELLDVRQAFGLRHVDHVFFSYSLSMMPDWRAAVDRGLAALAPGGALHAVDFWDLGDWPPPVRAAMRQWLHAFGVHASADRCHEVVEHVLARGAEVAVVPVAGRYAWHLRATRRP